MKKLSILISGVALSCNAFAQQWTPQTGCSNNIVNTNSGSVVIRGTLDQSSLNPDGGLPESCQTPGGFAMVNANFGGLLIHSPSSTNNYWGQNFDAQGGNNNTRYRNNGRAALAQIFNGNFYWYTGVSGTARTVIPNFSNEPKIAIPNAGGFAIGSGYAISSTNGPGVLTVENRIGLGTATPLARLHVDVSNASTTTGIRFQGLTTATDAEVLTVDGSGNIHKRIYATGGIQNSCGTLNLIPKVSSTGGNLGCSQLYDDGNSIGVNTTGPFNYTLNGSSGTWRMAVNGGMTVSGIFNTSDSTLKENVATIVNPFDLINELTGRTYNWTSSAQSNLNLDASMQYGVIAQEVKRVMPELVSVDENGKYAVNYMGIIPLLLEGEKELYASYQSSLAANKVLQENLSEAIKKLTLSSTNSNGSIDAAQNELYQNVPNPFQKQTTIKYNVISIQKAAYISILDLNGKQLKKLMINKPGEGTVIFDGNELPAGIYLYALIVDGQEISTKKMVLGN